MTWTLVEPHLAEAACSTSVAVRAEALEVLGRAVAAILRLPKEHLESPKARRVRVVAARWVGWTGRWFGIALKWSQPKLSSDDLSL